MSQAGYGPALTYKNKTFIIVLQETHCATADNLVIPNLFGNRNICISNLLVYIYIAHPSNRSTHN